MSEVLISKLEKRFGESFRLGPFDLQVGSGDTVAVMGKNGAGKSTFFQALTGNSDLSAGSIQINGNPLTPDAFQLKRQIGYLPQHLGLPSWVSANEVLNYASKLYEQKLSISQIKEVLDYWDCTGFANRPLAACSHGMQKRVGLALATFHDPDILVLDEPFAGLDIYHMNALERLLAQRTANGKCTFLSEHISAVTAQLCNRAIFLDAGRCSEDTAWPQRTLQDRMTHIYQFFFGHS